MSYPERGSAGWFLALAMIAGSTIGAVGQERPAPLAPDAPAKRPLIRLSFDIGLGFSSIPRFLKGAVDVPASLRFNPTILEEPHLVADTAVETRHTALFTLRAAPRIWIGPVSLGGGVEHPAHIESLLLDDNAVYSWETFTAWYETVMRETTRVFVEAGFRLGPEMRAGAGWMTSRLRCELRTGNDEDTYIPSDYFFVAEHNVSHGVYQRFTLAEESFPRFYAFMEYAVDGLGLLMQLAYGRNPFQGKTYEWDGAPLSLTSGPAGSLTLTCSLIYVFGQ
jgi:hypothetical protein